MRALDRNTLQGLWPAIPTPWDQAGKLDSGILTENCSRLAAAGVDGVYTTDADGEFYAIELEEFEALAKAFSRAMETTGVDAAMGVSWFNTQGVVDRIRIAVDAGIPNVHVALPLFMPLAGSDVDRFFDDLAKQVPEARWIHYGHPRSQPTLTGKDYARLAEYFGNQFIGTKIAAAFDLIQLTEILTHAPILAHQVGDATLAVGVLLGACGNCSYWANTLPGWSRRYMDACMVGDCSVAAASHKKLIQWECEHVAPLLDAGYRHGIIGRALGELTGFLVAGNPTRAPYGPVSTQLQAQLQSAFDTFWADEIRQETNSGYNR